jgi:NitT/TauT family transport system substrate-binding protein
MINARMNLTRRGVLALGATCAVVSAFPAPAVFGQQRVKVKIISNNGAENDTLEQLLKMLGYLEQGGLDAEYVKVQGPDKNYDGLMKGDADLCPVSGFNPLPGIAGGAPVKIIGSAMKAIAMSVFSANPEIRTVADLSGRTIGIGPRNNLLHVTMIALLRQKGIDEGEVKFVEIGSNAQVFQAAASGKVDAGPSTVASYYDQEKLGVHSLAGADMWAEIPNYTYQMMYASDRAISDNREGVVRTMAAYAKLFRYLQSPGSWDNYLKARLAALPKNDEREARAVWRYGQEQKPYGTDLAIAPEQLDYFQKLYASLGIIKSVQPLERIADMLMAAQAMKMLG